MAGVFESLAAGGSNSTSTPNKSSSSSSGSSAFPGAAPPSTSVTSLLDFASVGHHISATPFHNGGSSTSNALPGTTGSRNERESWKLNSMSTNTPSTRLGLSGLSGNGSGKGAVLHHPLRDAGRFDRRVTIRTGPTIPASYVAATPAAARSILLGKEVSEVFSGPGATSGLMNDPHPNPPPARREAQVPH